MWQPCVNSCTPIYHFASRGNGFVTNTYSAFLYITLKAKKLDEKATLAIFLYQGGCHMQSVAPLLTTYYTAMTISCLLF